MVRNSNTNTVIVSKPPSDFLPTQPLPSDAIHNVYELKTQPELVRYYHAAVGFPTKSTWLKAIKNRHFASWPGLTADAATRHFPDSEETSKGHGRKAPSGLRSTKAVPLNDSNTRGRPLCKERTIFATTYDTANEATLKIYTDQTGQFPKKSSRGNQYIMVLTKIDSNAILVEPMKNRTLGEMMRAYQLLID